VIVAAGLTWTTQRIDMHRNWASMLRETQHFRTHIESASNLLPMGVEADSPHQRWFSAELDYSTWSLNELRKLDRDHEVPLMIIDDMILTLRDRLPQLSTLNETERISMAKMMYTIGEDVVTAYFNILNYTSVDDLTGPPFWYSGPSPPDEGMLDLVAEMSKNVTKTLAP